MTSVREGGILVLPSGASREDFTPGSSLLRYIEENALHWYLHISKNLREVEAFPNGSLYLITGCDKTRSASCVTIPIGPNTAGTQVELQYQQDNTEQPWSGNHRARIRRVDAELNPGASYGVFLRGIKISLSPRSWYLNMEHTEDDMRPYYNILSKPIIGRQARFLRSVEMELSPTILGHPEVIKFLFPSRLTDMLENRYPSTYRIS